jgi:hypothetical protein
MVDPEGRMTEYGPTDVVACTHCWHTDYGITYTSWPPATPEICCHCGEKRLNRPELPPIPEGHGRYYPRYGTTATFAWYSPIGQQYHFTECPCTTGTNATCTCQTR